MKLTLWMQSYSAASLNKSATENGRRLMEFAHDGRLLDRKSHG